MSKKPRSIDIKPKKAYTYDSVCGIVYDNTPYYFHKNLQGDVIAIADQNGDVVARYSYDAWGVPSTLSGSQLIGIQNPYRYRGYYYDRETGLYYLQSRYYDPTTGRFINGDEANELHFASTGLTTDIFTYCNNDHCNMVDCAGTAPTPIPIPRSSKLTATLSTLIGVGVVLTAAYVATAAIIANRNRTYNKKHNTSSLVYDQDDVDMKFGKYTMSDVGCGVVAAHNALIFLKKKLDLASVAHYLDVRGYLYGVNGASIFAINMLLKSKKISTKQVLFPSSTDSLIKKANHKMAIIAYAYGLKKSSSNYGGHYMFICWDGNVFRAYNNDNKSGYQPISNIDKYIKGENGIYLGIIYF